MLVETPYAWLEDPLSAAGAPPAAEAAAGAKSGPLLTLEALKREHALACAGMAAGLSGPDACRRRDPEQLLQQLLARGQGAVLLHAAAMH